MRNYVVFLAFIFIIFSANTAFTQEGFLIKFDEGILGEGWSMNEDHNYSFSEGKLVIDAEKSLWSGFSYSFSPVDIHLSPLISLDIKTSEDCYFMIWMYDVEGLRNPVSHYIPASDSFQNYVFDFHNMYPTYRWDGQLLGEMNFSSINSVLFNLNPGGDFKGTIEMDNFAIGDHANPPGFVSGTGPYLDKVAIEIDEDSIAELDSHPLTDEDVHGNFVDTYGHRYENIQLHYRGASNLLGLINSDRPQRNWKVKVDADNMYRNRREWNFNFSTHARQEFSYHLFHKENVPCINTRHVNFVLNGERHGLYLEYEDPDNKPWLLETFGNDEGDLYKAATDIPGYPSYFAEFTYLGPASSDYFEHYRKKTNHKVSPDDYTSVRDLLILVNFTPNEVFIDSLEKHFDTEKFIRYLVISNFISNWDGYPHRGKNYWLYQNPAEDKWHFIPWDLDLTLQLQVHDWNQMGTQADLFYQFDNHVWAGHNPAETTEKPLVRRMMKFAEYRNAYIDQYRKSMETTLLKEDLFRELDSIAVKVRTNSENYEYQIFNNSVNEIKAFIHQRRMYVNSVLDTLSYVDTVEVTDPVPPYPDLSLGGIISTPAGNAWIGEPWPNPSYGFINLDCYLPDIRKVKVDVYTTRGEYLNSIVDHHLNQGSNNLQFETNGWEPGLYFIVIRTQDSFYVRKFVVAGQK